VSATADLLFVDGHVWTGEPTATGATRPVDAVAVIDGRIVALGHDARALRGVGTEVIDLAGGSLLPAFRDGHLHPLAGGAESLDCDLVDAADIDEVLARLAAFATAEPELAWVIGWGYPPEILPGGIGRADVLDAVVAGRPVALWSSDHHMVWCNSRALEVAGITAGTPDPARGTIVRDDDGHPAGTLLEEAERLLEAHLPPRGIAKEARGFEVGLARMAAAGLVFGQDAKTQPERLPAYLRVAGDGRLTADIDLAFKVEPDRWREQVADFVAARQLAVAAAAQRAADGVPGGRLTATTVKFFVDGVIEGGTGHLTAPYEASFGGVHACGDDQGIANWETGEMIEAAAAMDAAGFQLHCHAIGDAAVRSTLDTVEAVAARNGDRDRRAVVAHTHLVHPDDLPRFAQLGVIANLEPLWAQRNAIMTELTEPRLGPERSRWQYPIGELLRSGAHVSFGSDWPVSSHEPLHGIAVAVTRQTPEGEPVGGWLPEQRISLDQALSAYTAGTAHQSHDEGETGRLAVGQDADLVVTEQDVTRVAPLELAAVRVTGTWRRGTRVDASSSV
jgi:predicted amidohydrolase YtcJ